MEFLLYFLKVDYTDDIIKNVIANAFFDYLYYYFYGHSIFFEFFSLKYWVSSQNAEANPYKIPYIFFDKHGSYQV